METYINQISQYNNSLKQNNQLRTFDIIAKNIDNPYAIVNGKRVVIWCSNDYLNYSKDQDIINSSIDIIKNYGIGSGGTRNITGNSQLHNTLENTIANLHNKQASMIFTSAYIANVGFIFACSKLFPDMVIFSDQNNHASLIHGIRVSRLDKHIFQNNNMEDLESLLKKYDYQKNKLIIAESVYSMSGKIAKIHELVDLSKKYNALLYIDEVHAVGLYGNKGGGIIQRERLENHVWAINGTLGKSFGSIGGYVASDSMTINTIRNISSPFIFTTSLPPVICHSATKAIEKAMTDSYTRNLMHENVKYFINQLENNDVKYINYKSHIVIIEVGNEKQAEAISEKLLQKNIYIRAIKYPTVPKSQSILRICVSPNHTKKQIQECALALREVISKIL